MLEDGLNVGQALAAAIAAVLCLVRARRVGAHFRHMWGLMGVGLLGWAAGQGVLSWQVATRSTAVPWLPRVGFAMLPVGALAALAIYARRALSLRLARQSLLDGLIVTWSVFALSWGTVLGAAWKARAGGSLTELPVLLFLAIGDIALAALGLWIAGRAPVGWRTTWLLAAAMTAMAVADSRWTYLTIRGEVPAADVADLIWLAAFVLFGSAAATSGARSGRPPVTTDLDLVYSLIPYVPFVLVCALLMPKGLLGVLDGLDTFNAAALVTLVLCRQFLTLRDKRHLLVRLEEQQAALLQAHQELQQLARFKDDLVATITHELRTPLTGIAGHAENLATVLDDVPADRSPDTVAMARRMVGGIGRNAERLAALIDDLLTVAGSTAPAARGPVDLREALADVHTMSLPKAAAGDVTLTLTAPPTLGTVQGDVHALKGALRGVIDNAIKFSRPGGIVMVTATGGDPVTITIADDGMGIPLKEQPKVFERFYRTALARDRQIPGSGLGLTIARDTITGHNGTITLTSTPDVGTTVTITLPLTPGTAPAA